MGICAIDARARAWDHARAWDDGTSSAMVERRVLRPRTSRAVAMRGWTGVTDD